jgi:ribonucleotide monophosphatase NagD (HAD superfamily)
MIGDDVVSDVGGAQSAGIRGALVRSGKYTLADESHPIVKPDIVVDNLAQLVDLILA